MGAAIAAGSQKCVGTRADLVAAPASRHTTAMVTAGPAGGSAMTADMLQVPAVTPSTTTPTSIARPPAVVTTSACMAARRDDVRSA